jgi:uncharacterized protein YecE (DUF72 family)
MSAASSAAQSAQPLAFTGSRSRPCYLSPMARTRATRIGCAGWSIPSAHRALFGDGASMLARYATRFDCVEINSSFYRPHRRITYERWAASVPRGFRFSVKLPRTISHEQRLRGSGEALDQFLEECTGLGSRLGCLLLQLPPSLALDARIASGFFAMLRRRFDGPVACEPRHTSWFDARAEALLHRHRIARVAADPELHPGGSSPAGGPSLAYWRWHGSPRVYFSAYGEDELQRRAAQLRAHRAPDQWVIFDNTAHGHATADAARLQELLLSG